jgi:ferrous iron transport protein A
MLLSELGIGQCARVSELRLEGGERRRLLDLGFVRGVEVCAVRVSPLGDPTAYLVLGATVALRKDQAERIEVQR